jgi:hypothetical protein
MQQPTEQQPAEQQPAQQPAQQPQAMAYVTVGQTSLPYPEGNAFLQQIALQTATQIEAMRVESENRSRLTAAAIQFDNTQTQQRIFEMSLASSRAAIESSERMRIDRMAQRNRHHQEFLNVLRGVDTPRLHWQPGPYSRWP